MAHRQDVRPHGSRRLVAVPRGRGHVADADLRQAGHPRLLRGPPHRAAVAEADAVPLVNEVEMRVDLHDVEGAAALESRDAGDVDRVVAAEHHGQRAGLQNRTHTLLDIGMAVQRVGMNDVGVAEVDDADILEVGDVVLVVVSAGVAEGEQRRGLADGPRPEACAGPPLRAEVEGRTEDRDIGVDAVPIGLVGALAEGCDADERQVESSRVVAVGRHR